MTRYRPAANEATCLRLAAACGLPVPDTELRGSRCGRTRTWPSASAVVTETLDQVLAAIPATPGDARVLAVIREQAERISRG